MVECLKFCFRLRLSGSVDPYWPLCASAAVVLKMCYSALVSLSLSLSQVRP